MAKIPLTKQYPKAPDIPTSGGLGHKVAETFARAIVRARDLVTEWIEDRLINFAVDILERIESDIAPFIRPMLNDLQSIPGMPASLNTLINEVKNPTHQGIGAVLGGLASSTVTGSLGGAINAYLAPYMWEANKRFRPAHLDLQSCMVLMERFPQLSGFLQNELRELGYTDERWGMLRELIRNYPDLSAMNELIRRGKMTPEEAITNLVAQGVREEDATNLISLRYLTIDADSVRQLYLRGVITEASHDQKLRSLGLPDETITLLKSLYYFIPPAQDLISMAVREAFSPDAVTELGLDQDFPADFASWANKQGVSDFWAHKYWQAHWQLPSPNMGYEMYQRGIISYEQLASLLKALDYSPVWRDKLIQLAHSPYTRVDIRRMYQMGILSQEQVFRSYKDIGYDDEHATNLTIFTVTGASEEEKDLTKADIIAGYKDNILFREDAKALLMNLGYDETEAEFYLVRAEIDITTEQRKTRIDEIHTLYIKRVYLESQARNSLAQAGVSGLEVEKLIDKWNRELQTRVEQLTRADVKELYKRRMMSRVDTQMYLQRINYTTESIAQLLALWDNEIAAEAQAETLAGIRKLTNTEIQKLLWQGIITEPRAGELLSERGYDGETVTWLLESWSLSLQEQEASEAEKEAKEAEAKIRKPTLSEIHSLYIQEMITLDKAGALLTDIGVANDIRGYYQELWYSEKAKLDQAKAERAERESVSKTKLLSLSQANALYIGEFIDANEVAAILTAQGYSDTDKERLLTMWDADKERIEADEAEKAERTANPPARLLTRSQIGEVYKAKLITETEARSALRQLNYTEDVIDDTIALWSAKKEEE